MNPIVRPTGILVEDGKILVIKQKLVEHSHWTFPGGALDFGETIEQCLMREMKEETGLEVKVTELLYICDRFHQLEHHVVDMTFLVERTGGELQSNSFRLKDRERIGEIEMIPIEKLPEYGFSHKFCKLVHNNFPNRGSYQGDFHKFYGEP